MANISSHTTSSDRFPHSVPSVGIQSPTVPLRPVPDKHSNVSLTGKQATFTEPSHWFSDSVANVAYYTSATFSLGGSVSSLIFSVTQKPEFAILLGVLSTISAAATIKCAQITKRKIF